MTKSWKIINWDFVLDKNNNSNPIGFFNPTPELLDLLNVNNNTLFVTFSNTSSEKLDDKSFTAIFDKKSDSDQYSLCLKDVPFSSDMKTGQFSLMPSYVNKVLHVPNEEQQSEETKKESKDNKNESQDHSSGMNVTQLGLIGGILATGTILCIVGARYMLSRN
jgi:hypothetical protein